MMQIEQHLFPHLMKITEEELVRQITIQSLSEDDWPPDFDGNDIPIYQIILADLHAAESAPQHNLELGDSKILDFFLALISAYLKNNPTEITHEDYLDLQSFLNKYSHRSPRGMPNDI